MRVLRSNLEGVNFYDTHTEVSFRKSDMDAVERINVYIYADKIEAEYTKAKHLSDNFFSSAYFLEPEEMTAVFDCIENFKSESQSYTNSFELFADEINNLCHNLMSEIEELRMCEAHFENCEKIKDTVDSIYRLSIEDKVAELKNLVTEKIRQVKEAI
ncbi:hypothetical protein ACT8O7_07955 [Ornithobacterium rhinotracheale]|uniref:hypothetical protein n=1 Tax=Ornithobacterium rhinotracheale TaxID=28251 RepID=UPI00403585B1